MRRAARSLALGALALALAAGCTPQSGLEVTVVGPGISGVRRLELTVTVGGLTDVLLYPRRETGAELALPETAGVRLHGLAGNVTVGVRALDLNGQAAGVGSGTAILVAGVTVPMTVVLAPVAGGCGDGIASGTEACDGADLAGQTCEGLGHTEGTLACTAGCAFDESGCSTCGDGVRNGTEACDGADLGGAGCASIGQGFVGGMLGCAGACAFDTTGCFDPQGPDFNGDGWADVVVAARGAAGGVGQVHVFFGAPAGALDPTPDGTLAGEGFFEDYGWKVAPAGDLNGDGFDDVIVGARYNAAAGTEAGRAYVYFGGPGAAFDPTPDGTLTAAGPDEWFGHSLGPAGDVNGDGYGDVIVGAPHGDAGGLDAGLARIYHGGPGTTFDSTADETLIGAAAGDYFGIAVGSAGDVNGDGRDDVVVGATGSDAGATNGGRAYVYLGGPGAALDPTPDGMLTGATYLGGLGQSVAAGDVNGDGYDDVVVGQPNGLVGMVDPTHTYVYLGGPGAAFDPAPDGTLSGESEVDWFGGTVAAGDVNRDGYDDVVVGAFWNDGAGIDAGRAYVYLGGPGAAFEATPDATIDGEAPGDLLGGSLAWAGDVNGDGYGDVIVGASSNDAAGSDAGAAYVYFGGAGAAFEVTADWTLTGAAPGDAFGWSVAALERWRAPRAGAAMCPGDGAPALSGRSRRRG